MKNDLLVLFSIALLNLALIPALGNAQDYRPVSSPPVTSTPDPNLQRHDSLSSPGSLTVADRNFLDQALQSGRKEVHAAKLAQQRAGEQDVRELAALIEREHRDLNATLEAARTRSDDSAHQEETAAPADTAPQDQTAPTDGMNASRVPDAADDDTDPATVLAADPDMKSLVTARGADFDRVYLSMLVQMHQQSIAKYEAVANGSGHSDEVKTLAQQALPGLRRHADMASALGDAVAQE